MRNFMLRGEGAAFSTILTGFHFIPVLLQVVPLGLWGSA